MRAEILGLALWAALAGAAGGEQAARYPEGPLFQGTTLYYADMAADAVFRRADGRPATPFWRGRACGPTAIAPYREGFLVLCHLAGSVQALSAAGVPLASWSEINTGDSLRNPNDASADRSGGVYFSDPGLFWAGAPAEGRIVYLNADGELTVAGAGPFWYPNGVYFDAGENALYASEHLARQVLRFAVLAPGKLGAPEVFADVTAIAGRKGEYPEAGPDGLERGPDGDLYVCMYGEGRILRLRPDGGLREVIDVRTPFVTNVAFGPNGRSVVVGAYQNAAPNYLGEVYSLR